MRDYFQDREFGPIYPELGATVAKLRRAPRTPENIAAHGAAVLAAIKRKNDAALQRAAPSLPPCPCASGTRHNTGEAILAAVRAQQLAQLHRRPFPDPVSRYLTK